MSGAVIPARHLLFTTAISLKRDTIYAASTESFCPIDLAYALYDHGRLFRVRDETTGPQHASPTRTWHPTRSSEAELSATWLHLPYGNLRVA